MGAYWHKRDDGIFTESFYLGYTNPQQGKNKADIDILAETTEISEGIVFNKEGVKITAFLVDHAEFIDSALGYRN
jgi:hypothetical protein